jgi:tRNA 2-thiouridine synthesizing protein A
VPAEVPFSTADHEDETAAEPAALIASLRRIEHGRCRDCAVPYAAADALFSIALGFKDSPRCLACLALGLHRDAADLRGQVLEFIKRKDCYRQAWENVVCKAGDAASLPGPTSAAPDLSEVADSPNSSNSSTMSDWDAGDIGCGELVLALRLRLKALPMGGVLKLIARDPAAPEDLPSWCRLTGQTLLRAEHPIYWIRRTA